MRGFERATVFDLLDYLTSNLLLPLGGFAIAVFAGWVVPAGVLAEELRLGPRAARALRFLLRYLAPVGIAATTLLPFVF
jgi:NSS family neurotransmitter:Na+ symporter